MYKKYYKNKYILEELQKSTLQYFKDDDLATSVWINKYCLNSVDENNKTNYYELTPRDTQYRLASETYRIGQKFKNNLTFDEWYEFLKDFKYGIYQGSPTFGIGRIEPVSLSNCFVIGYPGMDSYGSICAVDEELVQISKRRGGCVEENTKVVIKNKGIIPIKNVKVGDYILSFNIHTKQDEWKKVKDHYYTDVKLEEQVEIIPSSGGYLKTSIKHPVLYLDNNEYKFKSIKDGYSADMFNKKPNISNITYNGSENDEIGWWIGHHMGDGTANKNGRIRILGDNETIIKKYTDILNKLSNTEVNYTDKIPPSRKSKSKTQVWSMSASAKSNLDVIEKYLDNQIGNKTYNWTIPSYIKENNLWIPFIGGLIDADGHVLKSGRIDIELCSKVAIYEIAEWLIANGQDVNVSIKYDNRKETFKPCYKLHIHKDNSIIEILKNYIFHDEKQKRLNNVSDIHQSNLIKLSESEIDKCNNFDIKSIQDVKEYKLLSANKSNINKDKAIGKAGLYTLLENDIITKNEFNEILSREKIESIKVDNTTKFNYIDIEVEDNNNYYAGNGTLINIHNCGTDLSDLRPRGAKVDNAAITSSGAVSFAHRYSNSTREVGQNGRRGALMLSMSIEHPDVEHFIDSKLEDGQLEGANISVRMTDDFLKQAVSNSDNPDEEKQRLWKKIIYNATTKAEPGVLFWDTILRESPADCYDDKGFKTVSTNPCFTGDTLVAVVDDKKIVQPTPIKDLALANKKFNVYSARQTKSTKWVSKGLWVNEVKSAIAFKTGTKKVIELKLSNGNKIKCTEDHRLALANKEYIEAKDSIGKTLHDVIFHDKWITHIVNINKAKVVEITEIGECDVYDLTVEDNHNFYIIPEINKELKFKRGVLVHNCGEIPLSPYDSCRLTAHNLYSYVENPFTDKAYFNWEKFGKHAQIMMMMSDNLVELELEKVQQIINKVENDTEPDFIKQRELNLWKKIYKAGKHGRRTGIGILGLGDMLAALGLKYGTPEATEFSVRVYEFLTLNSYLMSYKLVQEHGRDPFEVFDYNKERNNPFLLRLTQSKNFPEISKEIERMWKNGKGRRNIALMTIAPTGSTSIMTQTTSGLEPLFSPFYTRQRKIEKDSGIKPDTIDVNGDWFIKYNVIHYPFIKWYAIQQGITFDEAKDIMTHLPEDELTKIFELSPWYGATAQDCDWVERINMQAGLQKWIDHSISVTVNLPKGTKPDLVQTIYETAWKKGCKGCTIYVDGSKGNQILSTNVDKEDVDTILTHSAPTRPKELEAQIVRFNNNKEKWISVIGLYDGKPYELFTGIADKLDIPGTVTKGKIIKVDKRKIKSENSRYDFVYISKQNGEVVTVEGINDIFNREYYNYGKLISGLLRHGMPIQYVVSTIDSLEFDNDTINSWKVGVVRALRKYIKDKTETGDKCPECETKLRFENGCVTCPNCGYSQCS